ncbi:MAG: TRAP transporter substrate-binding protein DctP [Chromatiales bacterium]|nr:TRAP transporter substrate-binding protein DctP [Chromatiales bacterium]
MTATTFRWMPARLRGAAAGVLAALLALPAAAVEFKIATIAPEGSAWMRELRAAGEEVRALTDGRVRLRFYGGGVQGNDRRVIRKMRIGQLQGGLFTATGVAEIYPDIVIYGLPGLFDSEDEVAWVRERMDPLFIEGLAEQGLVSFGFAGGGFAWFMGSQPVTSVEALRGRKVWVPEGDQVSFQAMSALRLAPVVLPISDVLTGLQTDLIDVVASPPVGAIVLQWHTRVRYVSKVPVAWTMGLMAIDQRAFSRLDAADQAIFREVMEALYRRLDQQSRGDNEAAARALRDAGLRFVEPDKAELAELQQVAAESNRRLAASGLFSAELLEQVFRHRDEFRARQPAGGQADGSAGRN